MVFARQCGQVAIRLTLSPPTSGVTTELQYNAVPNGAMIPKRNSLPDREELENVAWIGKRALEHRGIPERDGFAGDEVEADIVKRAVDDD